MRRILGIVGWSGSGKTTLIERVLPLLRARGLTVSTIKHAHHGFDMDRPGKDSFRHRAAGASETLVISDSRWVLLAEAAAPPKLETLLERMASVDLVLVEGFKSHPFPKLEVYRAALGKPPLWPADPGVIAVATDVLPAAPAAGARHFLPLADPAAVAAWIGDRQTA